MFLFTHLFPQHEVSILAKTDFPDSGEIQFFQFLSFNCQFVI